jgi:hypothetical protein
MEELNECECECECGTYTQRIDTAAAACGEEQWRKLKLRSSYLPTYKVGFPYDSSSGPPYALLGQGGEGTCSKKPLTDDGGHGQEHDPRAVVVFDELAERMDFWMQVWLHKGGN